MSRALGFDFGTTNSVLAFANSRSGEVETLQFSYHGGVVDTLRSALCFWRDAAAPSRQLARDVGPWAIDHYIAHPDESRFMQSLKTFAASPHFSGAYVYAQRFRFEDLLEAFFARVQAHGGARLETLPGRLVIGRPVAYAGASPDQALAAQRYRAALSKFGFSEILFVYEPVAAAFFFAQKLQKNAVVLVADFGGGTTDFSIVRFEANKTGFHASPLAHGGVGIAGDAFDYHIIDRVVLPHLGKGGSFQSMGKILELPMSAFASFARWNLLSVLKSSDEFVALKRMQKTCLEPEKIQRMIDLVEDDQGYPLYKAVSEAKAQLSRAEETEFSFPALGANFKTLIRRQDFESWIAGDLARIEAALDATLARASLPDQAIDRVFLTGGTSFVPAVRRLFERRFGEAKIDAGDELLSIANGLALIGDYDDAHQWAMGD